MTIRVHFKHLNESQNYVLMIYGIKLILHLNLGRTINHRSSGMISGLSSKTAGSTTKTPNWHSESSAICSGVLLTTSTTIGIKSKRLDSLQVWPIRSLPLLRIKVPSILQARLPNFNNRQSKAMGLMRHSLKCNRHRPQSRHHKVKPHQSRSTFSLF